MIDESAAFCGCASIVEHSLPDGGNAIRGKVCLF